jgi:hypothetical protein
MMNTGEYDAAGAAIEAALVIGQALKLPDVIADTLSSRANI